MNADVLQMTTVAISEGWLWPHGLKTAVKHPFITFKDKKWRVWFSYPLGNYWKKGVLSPRQYSEDRRSRFWGIALCRQNVQWQPTVGRKWLILKAMRLNFSLHPAQLSREQNFSCFLLICQSHPDIIHNHTGRTEASRVICAMCANISMHHRVTTSTALLVNVDENIVLSNAAVKKFSLINI